MDTAKKFLFFMSMIFLIGSVSSLTNISTCEELQNMSNNLSENYQLINDINCSNTTSWNGGAGFLPVGTYTGIFDGKGYNISGLYISNSSRDSVGLFSATSSSAVIKNVSLVSLRVTGHDSVGGLVGDHTGTLNNTYINGTISGRWYVGGLVGSMNSGSLVTRSSAGGSVSGTAETGGIAGRSQFATIRDCFTSVRVSSSQEGGGIAGLQNGGTINNSLTIGKVTGSFWIGAMLGQAGGNGEVQQSSYWSINKSGQSAGAGLVGGTPFTAVNLTDTELINQSSYVGWDFVNVWNIQNFSTPYLVSNPAPPEIPFAPTITITYPTNTYYKVNVTTMNYTTNGENCWYSTDNWATNTSVTCGTNITGLASVEGSNTWRMGTNTSIGGSSYSSVTFTIDTIAPTIEIISPTNTTYNYSGSRIQLVNLTSNGSNIWYNWNGTNITYTIPVNVTFNEGSNTLTAYANDSAGNINSTSVTFTIISGEICLGGESNPCSISSWTDLNNMRRNLTAYYVLTANLSSADGDYSGIGNAWIPIGNFSEIFAGNFNGSNNVISDLIFGSPTSNNTGLFGRSSGVIYNLNLVNVNATCYTNCSGLAGYNSGNITNINVAGTIDGKRANVGGVVGWNEGNVSNSYANVIVNGRSGVGGLVGANYNGGAIYSSHSTGTITGISSSVGGLAGGNYYSSIIDKSYSTANATIPSGTCFQVGGLNGYNLNSLINNSYATGSVTAPTCSGAGGLSSYNDGGTIENSFSTGFVDGNGGQDGGLVGFNSGTITSSYYDMNTSGMSDTGKGVGKTTEEMKNISTYSGWDISTTLIDLNNKYPYLYHQGGNSSSIWYLFYVEIPVVTITYPTNTTYVTIVTQLNYTISGGFPDKCWYSTDGGATNSSSVNAGTNFTGLSSSIGGNTWRVYCNDTYGNLATNSVSFTYNPFYVTSCRNLNATGTYTIENDISFSGTCFDVQANDVVLDCQGYTMNATATAKAVTINGFSNFLMKNCVINMSGSASYVIHSGTSSGVGGWTFQDSNVTFTTGDVFNHNIGGGDFYILRNNFYLSTGSAQLFVGGTTGGSSTKRTRFHDNYIKFEQSRSIYLDDSDWYQNEFYRNIFNATSDNMIAISGGTSNEWKCQDYLVNNTFYVAQAYDGGCNGNGRINELTGNVFDGNKSTGSLPMIRTEGDGGGLVLGSCDNNTFQNIKADYIERLVGVGTATDTCTNTTFKNVNGTILFPSFVMQDASILGTHIVLSNNLIRVNSTTQTGFNTNSTLTINNPLLVSGNYPYRDVSDNGTFVYCFTCNIISDATPFIFEGVGFSGYQSGNPPDTFAPIINIVYPQPKTYIINISQLNYTMSDSNPDSCWYSTDGGVTNSTPVSAGTNFTGLSSVLGSNTWIVYCNDTSNYQNSTSVTFNIAEWTTNLISPANASGVYSALQTFTCNTSYNANPISNMTLNVWNSTEDLIVEQLMDSIYSWEYQETADATSVVGTANASFPETNAYDNDWDTYAQPSEDTTLTLYTNYTKPSNAVGGKWRVKVANAQFDPYETNISVNTAGGGQDDGVITQNCWEQEPLQLRIDVYLDTGSLTNFFFYCYNGAGWTRITYAQTGYGDIAKIYDDAFYWNVTGTYTTDYSLPNYDTYEWNCKATDNLSIEKTAISNWTITYSDNVPPIVSIAYPTAITYYTNITELNYTVYDGSALSQCWYSTDEGVTNTTITCGDNVTGLNSVLGSNTWWVWSNDTYGNEGSASVTFTQSPPIQICSGYCEIYNWTDLDAIRNNLSATYVLKVNLSSADGDYAGLGDDWLPLGDGSFIEGTYFSGTFDGNGNTISDLIINQGSVDAVGLFAVAYLGGNISNVGLINSSVLGQTYVGTLVGWIDDDTIVNNCYAIGNVTSYSGYVGGLIGIVTETIAVSPIINNSYFIGQVYSYGQVAGGLIGYLDGGTIDNSYSVGSVTSEVSIAGGLVAYSLGLNFPVTITNSYSTAIVNSFGNYAGGLFAYARETTIENCYATGNVTNGNQYVAGLISRSLNNVITNSYSTGYVTNATPTYVGGLIGRDTTSTITDSYYDSETSGMSDNDGRGVPKTTAEMKDIATYSTWDIQTSVNDFNNGYPYLYWQGEDSSSIWFIYEAPIPPIEIYNWTDLRNMDNDYAGNYVLKANLSSADTDYVGIGDSWLPVGAFGGFIFIDFTGTFDGEGNTISDIIITDIGDPYWSFIAWMDSATIENVGFLNASVSGSSSAVLSGLVKGNSVINNVYATGTVTCNLLDTSGGLIGQMENLTGNPILNNSWTNVSISCSGLDNIGGLVGWGQGTIENSYALGNVVGDDKVGGLVGFNEKDIINSYSIGNINATSNTGGLVGFNSGTITSSYYDNETSGQNDTGKGDGKTTAEMKDIVTYSGWDIQTSAINLNSGYPYLYSQLGNTSSIWFIYFEAPVVNTTIEVYPVGAITLNGGTTKDVNILFNTSSADVNETSAKVTLTNGAVERTSSSCTNVSTTFNCTITFNFYDEAGIWNINASILDNSANLITNTTEDATINALDYVSQNFNYFNWNYSLTLGVDNQEASNQITLTNGGNQDYATLNIKGQNATGVNFADVITADKFSIDNVTSSTSGIHLVDNTNVNMSSILNLNSHGASVTANIYAYVDVPAGIRADTYLSSSAWEIIII